MFTLLALGEDVIPGCEVGVLGDELEDDEDDSEFLGLIAPAEMNRELVRLSLIFVKSI